MHPQLAYAQIINYLQKQLFHFNLLFNKRLVGALH